MDHSEAILNLLSKKPGLRAQEIAQALGMEREAVNPILYDQLRGKVVQDNAYRWRLRRVNSSDPGTDVAHDADTPLARLARYYLNCVTHDIDSGVSLFAANKYGKLDYFDPGLPSLEEALSGAMRQDGMRSLSEQLRQDRNRKTVFLGYPLRVFGIQSRKGEWFFKVEPVMLFPIRGNPQHAIEAGFEGVPTVNFAFLRGFLRLSPNELMEEAIHLADQLGLANPTAELDEVFERLHYLRPDWPWEEHPDSNHLTPGRRIADIKQPGIYNRAIVCLADRSPYTQGLETELAELRKLPESAYQETALGAWLSGDLKDTENADQAPLLQAIPLNLEQRAAIQRAFSGQLTAITGPPGTGKSQVVTALLMNAAWRGQRVLFASKNNKAVDVVEVRVNALGPRPILLRLGNNEHRSALADCLSSLLSATATNDDKANYQRHMDVHHQLQAKMESQEALLSELVAVRNRTDHLEQAVESLRRNAIGSDIERLRNIPSDHVEQTLEAIDVLAPNVRRVNRASLPVLQKALWPFTKRGALRRFAKAIQIFRETLAALETGKVLGAPLGDSVPEWLTFVSDAQEQCQAILKFGEYFTALAMLQQCEPLEAVAKTNLQMIEDIADNSIALWQYWLRIQPAGLTQQDRKLLGDYVSLLRLIVRANREEQQIERGVFRRYYEIFPQVAHLLPCWAVTSLSARGRLPLAAGKFDLVVIDEASQCDIASALPLLFRAKRAVIIGDPQQLRHISAIKPGKDQQLLSAHGLEQDYLSWAYSSQSLYDLASSLCRSEDIVDLRDHHRSHSDIITFSNDHFYGGRLRVATNYNRLKMVSKDSPAVRWIDLRGQVARLATGSAVNQEEALAVVQELRRLLDQGYAGTIGVVSPFRAQADRIRDLVSRQGDLAQRLASADCLIDTIHRFQGDERDLIIFSPVVSSGISDGAMQFLKRNGNLFNVAITRARSTLVVIGDTAAAASSQVQYLESFARYVTDIAVGSRLERHQDPMSFGPEYPPVSRPERVSDWERYFYKALFAAGHRPIPQYSLDQYDLDFALLAGTEHRLDIEVDGERYHRDWDGELCRRDQIRNQRLMEMGWDVMRFWVYEIRDDLDGCIERVNQWVAQHSPK